jgi:TolB-like protein
MARSSERSATSALSQPSAAEVRAHLEALLHDAALAISDRNRRFLAYIVEETLAGRGDRIKAYNVALTAFDRTDDFDPQTDPIVRIEASRLRRALEHYYLTAGKTDPLRIEIPKGSYVATFGYAEPDPAATQEIERAHSAEPVPQAIQRPRILPMRKPPVWWIASVTAVLLLLLAWLLPILVDQAVGRAQVALDGPSILVLPFETGAGDARAFVARGITTELIGRLEPQKTLSVLGQMPTMSDAAVKPDFVLSGTATTVGAKIYISAALSDSRTGRYLWSWNVERPLADADLIRTEAAIAGEIADGITPLMETAAD